MDASGLLKELGRKFNVDLVFDADGVCSITLDERDVVEFVYKDNISFCLMAQVGSLTDNFDLLKKALIANAISESFTGCVFSVDESLNVLVLHRFLPIQSDYEIFEANVTVFVKTLREWKTTLENTTSDRTTTPDESDTSWMIHAIRV